MLAWEVLRVVETAFPAGVLGIAWDLLLRYESMACVMCIGVRSFNFECASWMQAWEEQECSLKLCGYPMFVHACWHDQCIDQACLRR